MRFGQKNIRMFSSKPRFRVGAPSLHSMPFWFFAAQKEANTHLIPTPSVCLQKKRHRRF